MMNFYRLLFLPAFAFSLLLPARSAAQAVNAAQQVPLLGLRTSAGHGSFPAVAFGPAGSAYLLYDQGDGLHVFKTDATGSTLQAQASAGAAGDSPVAITVDPAGNVYVSGTSTSGSLHGTAGAAFPNAADSSTNSFLAKYDANLNLIFLTFLGSGRTVVTSIAATGDAVFLTGITFNGNFAVTAAGIQQTPAVGSTENGFVERFTTDGTTLTYATYLTGANGDTMPAAIVADANDNAYMAGTTSASGFPTINALEPQIILAAGTTTSGFLTKLTPAGDGFVFSTFLAGTGVAGLALDAAAPALRMSGNFSLGGFPVANVSMPITSDVYQSLVSVPLDGSSVSSSTLLLPSAQSFVTADGNGGSWVSGKLGTPIFPGVVPPAYSAGDSFLLHINHANAVDDTLRFGGAPENNGAYTTLTSTVAAPAVNGTSLLLPGSLTTSLSITLLATQHFDLPLTTATSLLPNTTHDILPPASSCTSSTCTGSAGLLIGVSTLAAASLVISTDDLPNLTLRNFGSTAAMGLTITASGYGVATNCGSSLSPSGQCSIAVSGSGPGLLTVASTNSPTLSVPLAATTAAPLPIILGAEELDFGITSGAGSAVTRSLSISNLTATTQTFSVAKDGGATTPATFALSRTDCAATGTASSYSLASGANCQLVFSFTASSSSANDGPARATWKVGTRDVTLTGFSQAAAVSLSASTLDFGAQFNGTNAIQLPRYLFLSNSGDTPVSHSAVALQTSSPFTVVDECPAMLPSRSVCRLTVHYRASSAPSSDALTVTVDTGLTVLLRGRTLAAASANGSAANPSLTLSTSSITFSSPIVVTGISASTQSVTLKNSGSVSLPLTISINGDFSLANGCPVTLSSGASCSLLINFTPSQPGLDQGILSITAGGAFAPAYVNLSGTAIAILPANNGTLPSGQTLAGEPVVAWYKVQQPLSTLTVTSSSATFGVALVQDTGYGHGTLQPSSFLPSVTSGCSNCWLGVQFLSQSPGSQAAAISLSTVSTGKPYVLTATATALPVQGLLLTPVQQDFGTVTINSTSAPLGFTLANLLDAGTNVTVQSVNASGDFSIAPSQSGSPACSGVLSSTASCFMQVVFAPLATGQRTGSLTVVTNAGTVTASLTGFGEPDPGVAVNPTTLTFANVPSMSATQQAVTLTNTSAGAITVGTVTAAPPFLPQSSCSTLQPGSQCLITVNFTPQFDNVTGILTIPVTSTTNGQTSTMSYSVALNGSYTTADAGLEILPSEVNFGAASTGTVGETRLFTLNNLSGKPLNITLVMPSQFVAGSTAACPTLAAGASCSFPVTFLPQTAGGLTGTVFAQGISTDGSTNAEALTYMLGYGQGGSALAVSGPITPNSPLSFGQVASGQTSQKTLTLTNIGSASLTIRRLLSEPPFLAATTCGTVLAPAGSCTVTLTYVPVDELTTGSAAGARSDTGTLVIESDAVSSPDIVDLSGTVTPTFSSSPASSAVLAAYNLSQGSLTFPNTAVGNVSASQTLTMLNTGTTTLHLLQATVPADFTVASGCSTLLPGASCTFSVRFNPGNASMSTIRSGSLELLTDAGDALEFVSLSGSSSAAPLTLTPSSLDFGSVTVGMSTTQTVTLTNQSAAPITLLGLAATGDYTVISGNCSAIGSTIAAGSSCTLQVTLKATATGTRTGTLSVSTDATQQPLTVSLTANAMQSHLQISPGALVFGNVAQGATASLTLTLSNTGTASVTSITGLLSGTNASDFAVTVPCALASLAPGQSCSETVSFTPYATGLRSATLTLSSSDPSSPAVVPLTGSGVGAGTFQLTVNGGSAASVTVASGSAATFSLTVTPQNGYTGTVALTCSPIAAGPHATCSLLSSTLTIAGSSAQTSTATITTIASALLNGGTVAMLLLPLALMRKRKWATAQAIVVFLVLASAFSVTVTGCGSGTTVTNGGGSGTTVLKTPAGTYQYQVTASSTSGAVVSSSVTLNLIVQ